MSRPASMPRVSVVMPVFDGATYLTEAVESILGQTFADWELVTVDDGSGDDSPEILARYAAADSRIRVLRNETNMGVSATLNRGWREARGEYIARLDADDVALPDRFARQVEFLDAHPTVAVVGSAATYIDEAGRRLARARVPTTPRAIRSLLPRHNCFIHPSVLLRRAALEDAGGYRLDHVEDYDLWLRLSEHFDLANLGEPLVLYRLHPDQTSVRMLEEQARRALTVRVAARERRAGRPDPLSGMTELTPDLVNRLGLTSSEIEKVVETELLFVASFLADLGRESEARELLSDASERLGPRVSRALAAAMSLRRAEGCWASGHILTAFRQVLLALWLEPGYSARRLLTRVATALDGWRG
jgi:Glycosyl transferase family 2